MKYNCPFCGVECGANTMFRHLIVEEKQNEIDALVKTWSITRYRIDENILKRYFTAINLKEKIKFNNGVPLIPKPKDINISQLISFLNIVGRVRTPMESDVTNFIDNVLPWKISHPKINNSKELCSVVFPNEPENQVKLYQTMLDINPFVGHDASLSPFSENFVGYKTKTKEETKTHIRKITRRDDTAHNPTQINYWIKRGYNEIEAKERVHKRQQTFTKQKCIEKYGEAEGLQRWVDRQKKWLSNYKKQNYSMISQELFWTIYEKIKNTHSGIYFATLLNGNKTQNNENHEKTIQTEIGIVKLDFLVESKNVVIEFDGDYWHGEKRGNQKRDEMRTIAIKNAGYRVLHIKERDYNEDKEKEIKRCLDFINEN